MKKYLLFGKSNAVPYFVKGQIMTPRNIVEIDLGPDLNNLKKGLTYVLDGKTYQLIPRAEDVFYDRNWRGNVAQEYIFFDLTKDKEAGPLCSFGLLPFDSKVMFSAEKADSMIHNNIVRNASLHIIEKLQGAVGGPRKLMFILMFIAVVGAALLHFVFKVF